MCYTVAFLSHKFRDRWKGSPDRWDRCGAHLLRLGRRICGPALVDCAIVQFVAPLAIARLPNSGAGTVLSIHPKASKRCRGEADRQLIVVSQSQRQNFVVVKLNRRVDRSARQEGRGNAAELYHSSVNALVEFQTIKTYGP
jgi:hypothetical protein